MAFDLVHHHLSSFSLLIFLAYSFSFLVISSHCFNPKLLNVSRIQQDSGGWSPAGATWYGGPNGAGSDGGACGYRETVEKAPFSAMVSAGGSSIYQSGDGCGICYEVKCSGNDACSGDPVTVTITDECPGCEAVHFDLSGTAFGAMAKPGFSDQLRNVGVLQIQYKRVSCKYPGFTVAIRVDPGSNAYYLATAIEYANGDGIKTVELQQQGSGEWIPMQQSWGALWKLDAGHVLQSPLSLRLTSDSGKTLVLQNVIPGGWQPGQTYRSHVNFGST